MTIREIMYIIIWGFQLDFIGLSVSEWVLCLASVMGHIGISG